MQYLGIEYQMKHPPKLDPGFIPFGVWRQAYLKGAEKPIAIALERDKGRVSVPPQWRRRTTATWNAM